MENINDIEQTKESRAPQYQEGGEGGEKETHRSPSSQTDEDRTGEERRPGSKKEETIAFNCGCGDRYLEPLPGGGWPLIKNLERVKLVLANCRVGYSEYGYQAVLCDIRP